MRSLLTPAEIGEWHAYFMLKQRDEQRAQQPTREKHGR